MKYHYHAALLPDVLSAGMMTSSTNYCMQTLVEFPWLFYHHPLTVSHQVLIPENETAAFHTSIIPHFCVVASYPVYKEV
jgi:hypothetical protein